MYNDNQNNDRTPYEYHYRYRPDYSEPIPTLEPAVEMRPKKPAGASSPVSSAARCCWAPPSAWAGW